MLRELFLLSNLFVFPTREESFGLVGPEAAMSGVLMVYNRSLSMMWEISGGASIHCDFGSYEKRLNVPTSEKEYYEAIAGLIMGRLLRMETIACKSFARIRYNWDNLYEKFYYPCISETIVW
jgi:glycosyltransferase involved in cell wall biosynthesis